MIKKNISNKFYRNGILINPSKNEKMFNLNYNKIVSLFEENGFILFRGFNIEGKEITKITDKYTYSYANDAIRREAHEGAQQVRHVDPGNKEMGLHSEASFSPNWPEIIWFFCRDTNIKNNQGSTTFCDGIKLWDNLSHKVKNYFLSNPIKYNLEIPISNNKIGKGKKSWILNYEGSGNCILDLSKSKLFLTQTRFAAIHSRLPNKISFCNHLISSMREGTDPTIKGWSKVPKHILNEVYEKAEKLTYDIKWKKGDLVMIDNKRFMHGRRKFDKKVKRNILVVQSSLANFGFGSSTRKITN
tara:strand:+ start:2692 stop:3594 length:903 start_codon:yes stop_codon:yes gene_type:complete